MMRNDYISHCVLFYQLQLMDDALKEKNIQKVQSAIAGAMLGTGLGIFEVTQAYMRYINYCKDINNA